MTRRLMVLAILALGLTACPPIPSQGHYRCSTDQDCPGGSCSTQGLCVYDSAGAPGGECATDADCQSRFAGSLCRNGYCVVTGCGGVTCQPDEVCDQSSCALADGMPCTSGSKTCPVDFLCSGASSVLGDACLRQCKTYRDCLPGWQCTASGSGNVCVPAFCGPTQPDTGATFGDSCQVDGSTSGTCVGPEPAGLAQGDGLCQVPGSAGASRACDPEAITRSGRQCAGGTVCAPPPPMAKPPSYPGAACWPLCKGWVQSIPGPCGAGATCYPKWGALGVCVTRNNDLGAPSSAGAKCTGDTFTKDTPADHRPCFDGTICDPNGLCSPMCTLGSSGQCKTGTTCTAFTPAIPGHPNLGYCKL